MNNIEKAFQNSTNAGEFCQGYFAYLKQVLASISPESVNRLVAELEDARNAGSTIFIAGNGGSAATATTLANDIGSDILKKTGTTKPFRAFALTDNTSVITAIANDMGYENIFINQLRIHYRPGDKLIAISASGNSANVIAAAEWVKQQGGRVIGFLGFTGGELKNICDVTIHAESVAGEYGPVEDAHLIMNHVLAHWFQCALK